MENLNTKAVRFREVDSIEPGDWIIFHDPTMSEQSLRLWRVVDKFGDNKVRIEKTIKHMLNSMVLPLDIIVKGEGDEPDTTNVSGNLFGFDTPESREVEVWVRQPSKVSREAYLSSRENDKNKKKSIFGKGKDLKWPQTDVGLTNLLIYIINNRDRLSRYDVDFIIKFPDGNVKNLLKMKYKRGMEYWLIKNKPTLYIRDCENYRFEISYDNYLSHNVQYKNVILIDTKDYDMKNDVEVFLFTEDNKPSMLPAVIPKV